MTSILLIIPYFGNWPLWFDAFLKSCEANPTIQWFCPTDCVLPKAYPANITFFSTTLADLNKHVNDVVGAKVPLSPRKFCDLKPAYADIFAKQVSDYDFWGFCDMDIIWGNIRKFMTQDILEQYDIISSRKEAISGHFNLFRNTPEINALYKQLPDYKTLFEVPEFKWTDEIVLSNFIKEDEVFKSMNLKVYWPFILCNQENGHDSHQEYYLDKWLWKDGAILKLKKGQPVNEVMYLHFINWKRTIKYNDVQFEGIQTNFYISYTGLHYHLHTEWQHFLNIFKNVFNGYWIKEKRRRKKLKRKSFIKRVKRKLRID
ncbi:MULTISPECIES: DUF6625 family protein [Winogradskyella]|uniref:Uncharacterized protein n=1 Tax=Winogradskyella thalassocola TaxID=262004 RepID=A0A1G8FYS7_9FLAO|nr:MULTISPECIES: DUF6625 family protein [Winogradskyella]SDH87116.1 hypothetical protein SAMN04489796_10533 [Winogradskyella thalassocola]